MPYVKLNCCKYCALSFENVSSSNRANHSRWCKLNPKSIIDKKSLATRATGKGKWKHNEESIAKIKAAHTRGAYVGIDRTHWAGRKHSEDTKELIRQKALSSTHRRLRKKIIEYKGILLDSTWELALAKRLDELQIDWVRPPPLKWVDANHYVHNYFPDFYLPCVDLYLDPKNPHAVKVQKKKLDLLLIQHPNIKILHSLLECEQFTIESTLK